MPLAALAKDYGHHVERFDFSRHASLPWETLETFDAVFMSRPHTDGHANVLNLAKQMGKRIWIDLDDNYWAIPDTNWAHGVFHPQALANMEAGVRMADAVTVSTPYMRDLVAKLFGVEAVVVPNALPDRYEWPKNPRAKCVIYRGWIRTHMADLFSVHEAFQRCITDYPDWTFVFFGGHPIILKGANVRYANDLALTDFHPVLQGCGAAVMVNPLEFSEFNAAKSNIAWMEGTLAGAAMLCPDLPQYREPGCTLYREGEFEEALRIMLLGTEWAPLVAQSQKAIDGKYRLSSVNKMRAEVLSSLEG